MNQDCKTLQHHSVNSQLSSCQPVSSLSRCGWTTVGACLFLFGTWFDKSVNEWSARFSCHSRLMESFERERIHLFQLWYIHYIPGLCAHLCVHLPLWQHNNGCWMATSYNYTLPSATACTPGLRRWFSTVLLDSCRDVDCALLKYHFINIHSAFIGIWQNWYSKIADSHRESGLHTVKQGKKKNTELHLSICLMRHFSGCSHDNVNEEVQFHKIKMKTSSRMRMEVWLALGLCRCLSLQKKKKNKNSRLILV